MQIVITDGYTLNPGDLSWDAFNALGEVVYYDRSSSDQMVERCKNAQVIITNKTPVTAEVIDAAKELRLIAVTATGYNMVDVAAAKKEVFLFVMFQITEPILLLNKPLLCYLNLPIK